MRHLSALEIPHRDGARKRVMRPASSCGPDQAIFTELGLADVQDAVDKVDIVRSRRRARRNAGRCWPATRPTSSTSRHARDIVAKRDGTPT